MWPMFRKKPKTHWNMSTRDALIKRTLNNLNRLPEEKILEISEFTDFLLARLTDQVLVEEIQENIITSDTYRFLKEEEDIYTVNDL